MTLLQLALDLLPLDQAMDLVAKVKDVVDLIEVGTPMIKRYGISAVVQLRQVVPDKTLVADLKTVDAGAFEAELAFDAGADIVTVLACASDATVQATVGIARKWRGQVVADLLGVADKQKRAQELKALEVDYIGVHLGTDDQASGNSLLTDLGLVQSAVSTPLVVAGGIKPGNVQAFLKYKPAVIVVGSAITDARDPATAASTLWHATREFGG